MTDEHRAFLLYTEPVLDVRGTHPSPGSALQTVPHHCRTHSCHVGILWREYEELLYNTRSLYFCSALFWYNCLSHTCTHIHLLMHAHTHACVHTHTRTHTHLLGRRGNRVVARLQRSQLRDHLLYQTLERGEILQHIHHLPV